MNNAAHMGAPDWVLLGVPWGDEFAVFGSTELNRAELRAEIEQIHHYDLYRPPRPQVLGYRLTADLRRFSFAIAATYGEALAKLMESWDPDESRNSSHLLDPSATPALPA